MAFSRISLFKNTLALSIPSVLNPFISFLLVMAVSRYLGVEGLGEYSLVFAYMGIFGTIGTLGIGDLLVREAVREPESFQDLLFNAAILGTISSAVSLVSLNGIMVFMNYEKTIVVASAIMSLSLIPSCFSFYIEAVFRAFEKSQYVAITYIAENILRVSACIVLLLQGYTIIAVFVAILASRIFGFALTVFFYFSVFGLPKWKSDISIRRMLLREAPTFTSIAVFSTVYLSMDQIMLSTLKDVESVGIYSAADRLLSICKTVPVAFASALLPFFSKEYLSGMGRLKELCSKSLRYTCILLLPVVAGTVILAEPIITQIYGAKFLASAKVLQLHIVSLIPFSMVFLLAQVLIATDNQRVDLSINIAAAIMNFVLNLVLIPDLAEIGTVLATLLSVVVFNQLQYWYLRKNLFKISFLEIGAKPLLASVIMGVVTFLLSGTNLFLNISVSAVSYCVIIVALKTLTRDEIGFFTGLLRRR